MKCWECKKDVSTATRTHYYSPVEEKEATRDVCPECYKKIKFNGCHYAEVNKIRQRQLLGS